MNRLPSLLKPAGAALLLCTVASAAHAGDPTGTWLTAERESRIRVAPCPASPSSGVAAERTQRNPRQASAPATPAASLPSAKPPSPRPLCGTIVWLSEPIDPATGRAKTDANNPDTALRSRPLIGLPILLNMVPGSRPETWQGHVYNALNGKTYTARMSLAGANTLKIEGCILGGLFCGSSDWTRSN